MKAIETYAVDNRVPLARKMASDAFRAALDTGIAEASPGLPRITKILVIEGKPVAKVTGKFSSSGATVRPLTPEEEVLPDLEMVREKVNGFTAPDDNYYGPWPARIPGRPETVVAHGLGFGLSGNFSIQEG